MPLQESIHIIELLGPLVRGIHKRVTNGPRNLAFENNIQSGDFVLGVFENRTAVSKEPEEVIVGVALLLSPSVRSDRSSDACPIVVFVRGEVNRMDVVVVFHQTVADGFFQAESENDGPEVRK